MTHKTTSNKVKQQQNETRMLEEETKRMEEKLAALKLQVEEQKKLKETMATETILSKWRRTTNSDFPLKDYAKKVLADRKEVLNKYGINEKKIMNVKSFESACTVEIISSGKNEATNKLPKFKITRIIENKRDILTEIPIRSINNNFMKAKMNVKELIHRKTLQEFIEENYLNKYLPMFKENHIVELEDLYRKELVDLDLNKEKMNALGILPGHQTKIIKRIKEELEGKKIPNESEKRQTEEIKKGEKVCFGYGDGDVNEYQQINQEEDEKENKQQKKFIKNERHEEPHIEYFEANEVESENDESEEEDEVIFTAPQMVEFSIQTNDNESKKTNSFSFNCFQCYRKSEDKEYQSSDGRGFCSEACLDKYLQFMQKKCPECEQTFYKFNGYFDEGLWFCSIKCEPNREKIEEMFINWRSNPSE